MAWPSHDGLFTPVLQAMKYLGGSASIVKINDDVIKALNLTEANLA